LRALAISLAVFLTVLAAAALHAGWNAMLKLRLDPLMAMVLIHAAGSVIALPALFFTGLPPASTLIWLIASTILHMGYYFALAGAYRLADMGQVYPVARGSAPLLTGLFSVILLGEPLTQLGAAGIGMLGLGIFVMSLRSAKDATHMDRRALLFAGLTAVTICGYTLADGSGARASGNPLAYSAALFVMDGMALTLFVLWLRGGEAMKPILGFWPQGLAGGAMSCGSYTIAIWAMTVAPIPLVAAVRETSVLFGAVIAVVFLKEPLRLNRILAAVLIVIGLTLIRLQ